MAVESEITQYSVYDSNPGGMPEKREYFQLKLNRYNFWELIYVYPYDDKVLEVYHDLYGDMKVEKNAMILIDRACTALEAAFDLEEKLEKTRDKVLEDYK